jgi:hypothetical protein
MKRYAVLVALAMALAGTPLWAQDEITYFNRKTQKEERLKATIVDENASKVTYRIGSGEPESVPAADIIEIEYQAPRGVNALDFRAPLTRERRAALEKGAARKESLRESVSGYRDLLPRLPAASKYPRRNVQFRMALVLTALADDDPTQIDAAIDALKKFRTDHPDSWQIVPAVKAVVRLQERKGDAAAALASYEEIAENDALPDEVRKEFGLLAVRHLLRQGKPQQATARVKAIQSRLSAASPLAAKAQVYALACDTAAGRLDGVEPRLKALLASDADSSVKALARNTLGDYYRARGQMEEAFWQYLWVDVHYNQDREELARALYHLAKLFADVRKDAVRARECLDRLCDEKTFGGLEYHRRALAEKPQDGG